MGQGEGRVILKRILTLGHCNTFFRGRDIELLALQSMRYTEASALLLTHGIWSTTVSIFLTLGMRNPKMFTSFAHCLMILNKEAYFKRWIS